MSGNPPDWYTSAPSWGVEGRKESRKKSREGGKVNQKKRLSVVKNQNPAAGIKVLFLWNGQLDMVWSCEKHHWGVERDGLAELKAQHGREGGAWDDAPPRRTCESEIRRMLFRFSVYHTSRSSNSRKEKITRP